MSTKKKAVRKSPALANTRLPVPLGSVEQCIYMVRGQKVMIDRDLATLYQVETKALNRAVKRNRSRFPEDFRFQLTDEEAENLRCQSGASSWGGRRYLPYAFTEHGAVMLASVLSSRRAVEMSIVVVRAFITLREVMATNRELARRVADLENGQRAQGHSIASIHETLKRLMEPPAKPPRRIGFLARA